MGYVILGLAGLLLAVLLIRTAMFRPKKQPAVSSETVAFDRQRAVDTLSKLIQCKTVSYIDPAMEDETEFSKLIDFLPHAFPKVFECCEFQKMPDRGLLFRWPGKTAGDPTVLMAHYDVVPVDEAQWEKPPFSGLVENGIMWGRGTLDTKGTFSSILTAAENLIEQGFTPENDIYFAFSGGEEVNGLGAAHIVDYFIEKGIHPALVLDEGGAVVENVFPGVKKPCAMIGIAEKGMMNVRYSTLSSGGHASAPAPKTPLTTLSKACLNVVNHPFKMHINKPAQAMFDTLGRHSSFGFKVLFANLWLFKPVLNLICRLTGGDLNALVRTTTAFTQAEGSNARNVIPTQASFVSNMRLNPADSVASAKAYLEKVVHDKDVSIEILESHEPSPVSRLDCAGWEKVAASVAKTWNGCIVSPYLMVQCSDSRHYGRLSDKVYRFSGMDLTAQERKSIHGNNECVRLETLYRCVEFYIRLIKKC